MQRIHISSIKLDDYLVESKIKNFLSTHDVYNKNTCMPSDGWFDCLEATRAGHEMHIRNGQELHDPIEIFGGYTHYRQNAEDLEYFNQKFSSKFPGYRINWDIGMIEYDQKNLNLSLDSTDRSAGMESVEGGALYDSLDEYLDDLIMAERRFMLFQAPPERYYPIEDYISDWMEEYPELFSLDETDSLNDYCNQYGIAQDNCLNFAAKKMTEESPDLVLSAQSMLGVFLEDQGIDPLLLQGYDVDQISRQESDAFMAASDVYPMLVWNMGDHDLIKEE